MLVVVIVRMRDCDNDATDNDSGFAGGAASGKGAGSLIRQCGWSAAWPRCSFWLLG